MLLDIAVGDIRWPADPRPDFVHQLKRIGHGRAGRAQFLGVDGDAIVRDTVGQASTLGIVDLSADGRQTDAADALLNKLGHEAALARNL